MPGPRRDRCVSDSVLHWTVLIKNYSVHVIFKKLPKRSADIRNSSIFAHIGKQVHVECLAWVKIAIENTGRILTKIYISLNISWFDTTEFQIQHFFSWTPNDFQKGSPDIFTYFRPHQKTSNCIKIWPHFNQNIFILDE